MLNLKEVEDAKALMKEAVNWSVMKWLSEKKRVRKAADVANAVLDALDKNVKDGWSNELQAAYHDLPPVDGTAASAKTHPGSSGNHLTIDPEIRLLAKSIRQADEAAYRARMDAEDTFDLAEKRLSTSMAREGTRKAIASWDLHEKAIIKSQNASTHKTAP